MSPWRFKLWGWGLALCVCAVAPAPDHTVLRLPLLVGTTTVSGKLSKNFQEAECKIVYRKHDQATLSVAPPSPGSPALGGSLLSGVELSNKQAEHLLKWHTEGKNQPYRVRVPEGGTLEEQFNRQEWAQPNTLGTAAGYFVSPVVVLSAEQDFEPIFFSRWRYFSLDGTPRDTLLPLLAGETFDIFSRFPGLVLYHQPYLQRAGVAFDNERVNAVTILHAEGSVESVPDRVYVVLTKELARATENRRQPLHILRVPTALLRFPPGAPTYAHGNAVHNQWLRNPLPDRGARNEVRNFWKNGDWILMRLDMDVRSFGLEIAAATLSLQLQGLLADRQTRPGIGRAFFAPFWPHFCKYLIAEGP